MDSIDPDIHVLDGWRTGSKNTPSMHHQQTQNVTTSIGVAKNGHVRKNLTENGDSQRYSWEHGRRRRKLAFSAYETYVA